MTNIQKHIKSVIWLIIGSMNPPFDIDLSATINGIQVKSICQFSKIK
jgi:hypothetical protein